MIMELNINDRKQFKKIRNGKKTYHAFSYSFVTEHLLFPGDRLLIRCPDICDKEGMQETICAAIDSVHFYSSPETLFNGLNVPIEEFGFRKDTSRKSAAKKLMNSIKEEFSICPNSTYVAALKFHLTDEDPITLEKVYIEELRYGTGRIVLDLR